MATQRTGRSAASSGSGYSVTFVGLWCNSYTDIFANRAGSGIVESLRDLGPNTQYGTSGALINPIYEKQSPQSRCHPISRPAVTIRSGAKVRLHEHIHATRIDLARKDHAGRCRPDGIRDQGRAGATSHALAVGRQRPNRASPRRPHAPQDATNHLELGPTGSPRAAGKRHGRGLDALGVRGNGLDVPFDEGGIVVTLTRQAPSIHGESTNQLLMHPPPDGDESRAGRIGSLSDRAVVGSATLHPKLANNVDTAPSRSSARRVGTVRAGARGTWRPAVLAWPAEATRDQPHQGHDKPKTPVRPTGNRDGRVPHLTNDGIDEPVDPPARA